MKIQGKLEGMIKESHIEGLAGMIYIYIYIYIYREDFAQQYGKCGARSGSPQLREQKCSRNMRFVTAL